VLWVLQFLRNSLHHKSVDARRRLCRTCDIAYSRRSKSISHDLTSRGRKSHGSLGLGDYMPRAVVCHPVQATYFVFICKSSYQGKRWRGGRKYRTLGDKFLFFFSHSIFCPRVPFWLQPMQHPSRLSWLAGWPTYPYSQRISLNLHYKAQSFTTSQPTHSRRKGDIASTLSKKSFFLLYINTIWSPFLEGRILFSYCFWSSSYGQKIKGRNILEGYKCQHISHVTLLLFITLKSLLAN
jgi:hypothetical protein